MTRFSDKKIEMIFRFYLETVRPQMLSLRELVFATAEKVGAADDLQETLKWGEPSYVCSRGSTIRMNWKVKDPEHYRLFFHCQTNLIETFRALYPESFHYEGNRAVRFRLADQPDLQQLGQCIALALTYHDVKHLPLLGT
jgi:hypothetical protein